MVWTAEPIYDGSTVKGTLLFVHSSQVYMEELNDDSSSIRHGSTTEPAGTEPSFGVIHHASSLLSSLRFLSASFAEFSRRVSWVDGPFVYVFCCQHCAQIKQKKLQREAKANTSAYKERVTTCEDRVCAVYVMEGETAGKVNGNPAAVDLIPS